MSSIVVVSGLAVEARIGAGPGVICLAGDGESVDATRGTRSRRLRAALEQHASRGARGFMSFGLAGGLAPGLKPGAWLVARAIVTGSPAGWTRWETTTAWTRSIADRLPGAQLIDIAGSDEIVAEQPAKEALHAAAGAAAVDMESHIVAAAAVAHGLPFAAFRVVADPLDRPLPPAARIELASGGRVPLTGVLRSLMAEPGQMLSLLRTAIDAGRALQALSRGRRQLGASLACPDLGELSLDVP